MGTWSSKQDVNVSNINQTQIVLDKNGVRFVAPAPVADVKEQDLPTISTPTFKYDDQDIRDCILLAEASYDPNPSAFLNSTGHRFTGLLEGQLREEHGHFLIAEQIAVTPNIGAAETKESTSTVSSTVYLSIRGSVNAKDWKTNFSAWSTVENFGFMHS